MIGTLRSLDTAGMVDDCLARVRATNEHASNEEDHITTPIAVHVFPSGPEVSSLPSMDAAEQAVTHLSRQMQRQIVIAMSSSPGTLKYSILMENDPQAKLAFFLIEVLIGTFRAVNTAINQRMEPERHQSTQPKLKLPKSDDPRN